MEIYRELLSSLKKFSSHRWNAKKSSNSHLKLEEAETSTVNDNQIKTFVDGSCVPWSEEKRLYYDNVGVFLALTFATHFFFSLILSITKLAAEAVVVRDMLMIKDLNYALKSQFNSLLNNLDQCFNVIIFIFSHGCSSLSAASMTIL